MPTDTQTTHRKLGGGLQNLLDMFEEHCREEALEQAGPQPSSFDLEWFQVYFRTFESCKARLLDSITMEKELHIVMGNWNK